MHTFGDDAMLRELTDRAPTRRAGSRRFVRGADASDSNGSPGLPRGERSTPTAVRLVRSARVLMHIVGGLGTTVFVFPWVRSGDAAER